MFGILTYIFQGYKLTSGILFAVLLNFKHIYMYLAVILIYPFSSSDLVLTAVVCQACIFYLSAPLFLHVALRTTRDQEFPNASKRSDRSICRVPWTVHPYGSNTTIAVPTVPFYERPESRVLGSKCVGFGNSC